MDYIDQNLLIAKFFGLSTQLGMTEHAITGEYIPNDELEFHCSWDWLIPVVKKIRDFIIPFDYESEEYKAFTEAFDPTYTVEDFLNNEIHSIYYRTVEFIKWYNRYQKTGVA